MSIKTRTLYRFLQCRSKFFTFLKKENRTMFMKQDLNSSKLSVATLAFASAALVGTNANAATIYSDTFDTGIGSNYTGVGVTWQDATDDVIIARANGNFLKLNAQLALDVRGSSELTIGFDYYWGSGMFGATYFLEYSGDGGSTWLDVQSFVYSGSIVGKANAASYSTTLVQGASLDGSTVDLNDTSTFRIAVFSNNPKGFTVDNIVVSDDVVPEPGSLALLGLGGLMMIKRRRRD
jgi:hypothetical protein